MHLKATDLWQFKGVTASHEFYKWRWSFTKKLIQNVNSYWCYLKIKTWIKETFLILYQNISFTFLIINFNFFLISKISMGKKNKNKNKEQGATDTEVVDKSEDETS